MSKMDAQRAMREAKYARLQSTTAPQRKESGVPVAPSAAPAAAGRSRKAAASPAPSDEPSAAGDQLCGHKSMNGRTCTREHGHSAKSHRYS